jgi:hypothetical protein
MSDTNLPVKSGAEFMAEAEVMDLGSLKEKQFFVAVSQGDRSKPKFVSTTVRGPFNFVEMCEEVGVMWKEEQHHAKVVFIEKLRTAPLKCLDENTVDYIECHYADIITEAMLDGVFDEIKEYTCQPGIVEATAEDDPRLAKKNQKALEEPKDEM